MAYRDLFNSDRRAGGLLLSAVLAVAAFGGVAAAADTTAATVAPAVVAQAPQGSYADVLSRVSPAVVTVRASRHTRESQQMPFMDDPALRELFGDRFRQQQPPRSEERVERGLGSGVIV